jgi:predicted dehydrogenase
MQRREFLQSAGAAAAVAAGESSTRGQSALDRVRFALIGCGGRGRFVAGHMRQVPGTQLVAVCDVYERNREQARQWAGPQCQAFADFRQLLDRNDIDAVLVATPDHWHATITVLACQAGKDVYVEKPVGHNIREGQLMVRAARQHQRVVQVGTQQRSAAHFQRMREIVQSGTLGPVHLVRIWNYRNIYPSGIGRQTDADPPPGLDWDFYLGPAPEVPFHPHRFLGNFRWFWDYAGGIITDWGTHRFDSMHQVMGVDSPRTISAAGGRFQLDDGGEVPDTMQVTYEYPGFVVSYEASALNAQGCGGRTPGRAYYRANGLTDRPNGLAFYGTQGTLMADRLGFEILPELARGMRIRRTHQGPLPDESYRMEHEEQSSPDSTRLHTEDFIQCVRSRQRPRADIEVGHRSSIVPHLGNIAYRTGRKLQWDGQKEEIIGDAEASMWLEREPRKKWDLLQS